MQDETTEIEFWFDFGSPASYLAYTQAETLGGRIVWRPMLLGGVFKATGNASPVSVPAKGRWMTADLRLWADRRGTPFTFNPHFPINTLTLMRGAVGMQMRQPEDFTRYCDAVFAAIWQQRRDMNDPAVVVATLAEAAFDPADFTALVSDPDVKARLIAATDEAVARGVFGAPTFFVGDAMFFGQDRLDFVRDAAAAAATA